MIIIVITGNNSISLRGRLIEGCEAALSIWDDDRQWWTRLDLELSGDDEEDEVKRRTAGVF
ncbi:hypothetical protein TorRG33x02_322810 [Trema orientale]|uniref:Uncharacterized protein n=1 Tax=Trema orientale TaxID=63057 RepID=A0A2P5BFQ5_TREOI|nr:hypothetical protein TorRG33x02_322810 [Trema orientale]